MTKLTKLLSLLAVIATCFALGACSPEKEEVVLYGSITGQITADGQTNFSSFPSVTITPGDLTQTVYDGYYMFTDLEPGSYTLTVECNGYESQYKFVYVTAGEDATCDFALEVPADYSSATVESCDSRIDAEIISCKRTGGKVTLKYMLTNNGIADLNDWRIYPPKSISLISGGTRSNVWDNAGQTFDYPEFYFRYKTVTGSNVLNCDFPVFSPSEGWVTVSGVSPSATELNVVLGVFAYPNSVHNLSKTTISFLNVPIY